VGRKTLTQSISVGFAGVALDLSIQLSGQSTWVPCAVEYGVPHKPGSKLGPGESAITKEIF